MVVKNWSKKCTFSGEVVKCTFIVEFCTEVSKMASIN